MFASCNIISLLTSIFALHLFPTYSQKQNKIKKKKENKKQNYLFSYLHKCCIGPRARNTIHLFIHISDIVNFSIKIKVKSCNFCANVFQQNGYSLPWYLSCYQIRSDQISRSVVSNSFRPHESQHARPPCPSPTPGVHSDSHPSGSVIPSSHLILCRPLLLLPPIPPSIRVFLNESTLHMRWPKYWSFSFAITPAKRFRSILSLVQAPELMDHAVVFSTALGLQAELENTSLSSALIE